MMRVVGWDMSSFWAFCTAAILIHMLPAVDRYIRPRDECRFLGTEIGDETCDFLGFAEAADGDLRDDLRIEDVFRDRQHHLGPDVARRDRVYGDALARVFQGERLGEAVHARLRRGVVGLPESAFLAVHR